ncbi:winged helix-turn-helix domain-containing protein [Krasilnikovia sp. MM14-A1259]
MLQIHFSPDDLTRVRFAPEPRIAWELSGSVQLLQCTDGALVFDGWRQRARRWAREGRNRVAIHLLSDLFPHFKYFPDYLTPTTADESTDSLIDAILSTGRSRRLAELSTMDRMKSTPPWLGRFATEDRHVENAVAGAVHLYQSSLLGPVWPTVAGLLQEYRDGIAKAMLLGGVERALATLGPSIRWNPPILEADYPVDQELHLDGRGLEIVPSFFCWRMPVTMADPELPPTLVVPIERLPGRTSLDSPGRDSRRLTLGKLLGRTRATILEKSVSGVTSAQLCRSAAVSPASVSHHLAVMRDSGLVVSHRHGVHLVHEATELGRRLLACS